MTSITPRLNRSREGRDGSYPLVIQIIRHRKKREIYTPYRFWEAEFNTRLEMVENTGGNRRRLLNIVRRTAGCRLEYQHLRRTSCHVSGNLR